MQLLLRIALSLTEVKNVEKKVLDTPPLNLINFKACKSVYFQGMRMRSGREGAR